MDIKFIKNTLRLLDNVFIWCKEFGRKLSIPKELTNAYYR